MAKLEEQSNLAQKPWAQRLGWFGVLLIMVWLILVSVALVIRTGLFDFSLDISDAKVTAAVWTFVGTGFAAVVALVGALFTSSYNNRTLQLAQQAETRAGHEAAAAFLSLLGGDASKGTGPNSAQISGAVLILMGLKHTDAARGILQAAIYEETLNPPSAAALISEFLKSNNDPDQLEASRLLRRAAEKWTMHDRFEWPISISKHWPKHLPQEARINVLVAIGAILSSQDRKWWEGKRDWAVFLLDEAMREDKDKSVNNSANLLLDPLLESFQGTSTARLNHAGESLSLDEFHSRHKKYDKTPRRDVDVRKMADCLKKRWFKSE